MRHRETICTPHRLSFPIQHYPHLHISLNLSPCFLRRVCGRQILVGQDGHSVRAFVAGRCDSCEEWDVALGKTVFAELADMNENDDGLNAEPPINVRWRVI